MVPPWVLVSSSVRASDAILATGRTDNKRVNRALRPFRVMEGQSAELRLIRRSQVPNASRQSWARSTEMAQHMNRMSKLDRIVAEAKKAQQERARSYREQALKILPWIC